VLSLSNPQPAPDGREGPEAQAPAHFRACRRRAGRSRAWRAALARAVVTRSAGRLRADDRVRPQRNSCAALHPASARVRGPPSWRPRRTAPRVRTASGETSVFAHGDLCPFNAEQYARVIRRLLSRRRSEAGEGFPRPRTAAPLRTDTSQSTEPACTQYDGRARRSRSSRSGSFSRANGTRGRAPASALVRPFDIRRPVAVLRRARSREPLPGPSRPAEARLRRLDHRAAGSCGRRGTAAPSSRRSRAAARSASSGRPTATASGS